MLSREGMLPVLLLPTLQEGTLSVVQEETFLVLLLRALHPLQYFPHSDRSEQLAKTYRLAHMST